MNISKIDIKIRIENAPYEQLTSKIKDLFFNFMHSLLKNSNDEIWLEIIIIILQTLQMLAFPCSLIFTSVWKSGVAFIQMSFFFHYFQLVTFLQDNEYMYQIIFFICIILILSVVILMACCLVYISKNGQFSKGKLAFMNTAFHLLSTVLYLPILQILMSVFYCVEPDQIDRESAKTTSAIGGNNSTNSGKKLRSLIINYYVPNMTCYQSYHYIYVFFGGIFIIILFILCYIITMTLIDSRINNTSPHIKQNCTFDKVFLLIKTVLCIIFCFFGKTLEPSFFMIILLFCSGILLYTYANTQPYFNPIIKSLHYFCIAVFTWASIVIVIGMILQETEFDGAIPLFIIGIPGAGIVLISNSFDYMKILLVQIITFTKGEQALNQIRLLLHIINNKEKSRAWKILLKGYACQYESTCPLVACPLKKYLFSLEKGSEINILLLQHVELLFDIALGKFPQCTSLRIGYCFFLFESLNQKQQANQELIKVENLKPPFEEEFIIFHFKKLIEEQATDLNEAEDNHDIIISNTYKNNFVLFKDNINKVATLYIDFWTILLHSSHNQEQLTQLNKSGSQIQELIKGIKDLFEKMQKIRPNDQEVIYYYYDFLNNILNDSHNAAYYQSKLNQLENTKEIISDSDLFNLDTNTLSLTDEYQYIVLSGCRENFGIITHVSFGVCSLLGYYKEDLIGKANEVLMPEIFHKMHRHMLYDKVNLFKKEMTDIAGDSIYKPTFKEVSSFARNKARYLVPVTFQVALISTETEGISFIAKLKQDTTVFSDHPSVCHIITNNQFAIQNYTANAATLLKLHSNMMSKTYDITTFIKQFHEEYIKNIYEREGDDISFEQKTILKRQIINNKFRSPIVINWRLNDVNDLRYRSSKILESQLSSSADMNRLNKYISQDCQMTLTVHDADIGGKQEGYIFKFASVNAHNSSLYISNNPQLFASFHNIKEQTVPTKKSSLKVMKISKKNNNDLNDTIYDQLKSTVPEGNSVFVLNMKDMSYVMNSTNPLQIREVIKDKAIEMIQQTIDQNNQTMTSALDSSCDDSISGNYTASNNSQKINSSATITSDSEYDLDEKNNKEKNNTLTFEIPKNFPSSKKFDTKITEDYYKVIMTNIKYSLYSFKKNAVIEIPNYPKKSQVEAKMYDNYYDEKTFITKKSVPEKEQTKENDETEIVDKEGILIQQIEQALIKEEIQPTIIRLKFVSFFVILIAIIFDITWGILTLLWNNKLNENYLLIKDSSYLIVNVLFSQANIRDLTLFSHENYTNSFKNDEAIIQDLTEELKELFTESHSYNVHIITSHLSLSQKNMAFLYKRTIQAITIMDDNNVTSYNMTLSSTFIEVNTAAFHISKNRSDFYPTNKYIFFYMYNINNQLLNTLIEQEAIFVEEFGIIIKRSREMFIILIVVIYSILIASNFLFAYAYNAVAQKKDSYLTAFWYIESGFISGSLRKCEQFTKKMQYNSFSEFLTSEDNDHEDLPTCPIRRNKTKVEIAQQSKETICIKVFYGLFVFMTIILSMLHFICYIFFLDKLNIYMEILKSQNEVFIEHLTVYRNLREFVFDDTIIVENQSIGEYFPNYILTFFSGLFLKMTTYLSYREQFPASYSNLYTSLYHTELCELLVIPGNNCTNALFRSTNYGLEILLSVFVEEIRELKNMILYLRNKSDTLGFEYNLTLNGLDQYKDYFPEEKDNEAYFAYSPINIFNNPTYHKVKFIYEYFLKPSIKLLQKELSNCFESYIKKLTILLLLVNGFYFLFAGIIYLCIWKPHENSLYNLIYKSKNMLRMIPNEILVSLPNMQNILNINQSFNQPILRTKQ